MLWAYVPRDTSLERVPIASKEDVPDSSSGSTRESNTQEDKIVEHKVGIAVPTARKCRRSKLPVASMWRMGRAT
jgi:hypothetical protein